MAAQMPKEAYCDLGDSARYLRRDQSPVYGLSSEQAGESMLKRQLPGTEVPLGRRAFPISLDP